MSLCSTWITPAYITVGGQNVYTPQLYTWCIDQEIVYTPHLGKANMIGVTVLCVPYDMYIIIGVTALNVPCIYPTISNNESQNWHWFIYHQLSMYSNIFMFNMDNSCLHHSGWSKLYIPHNHIPGV
jgi:hypothetical protein